MSFKERWNALFRPNYIQFNIGGDAPTDVLNYSASQLYATQENLRAVVDFLSNSIAQLPLKVYVRNEETERQRDRNSEAARLLWRPNGDQTAYEFFRGLAIEYFVYGSVYCWVFRDADSPSGWQIRLIPSGWVTDSEYRNVYAPESIRVQTQSGLATDIPRSEFVQFRTYSPGNPGGYVSPISALRQTLQEQIEAGNYRKQLWKSSGRLNATLTRPANVQPWDDETRRKFITAFREAWGPGGSKAGSIPLLEDGMELKPFNSSFKESQWAESVKLSRESVAAAYGVNPSLIWHTETQTYASAKDNARALYAECLGPVLQMFQQRINSFLLPMIGADPDTYVEFDLTEKLKGSFEERASILQSAVGGPWMTRNEARADNNLPPVDGGDDLIVPLNVIEGGQASPTDTHMDEQEPMTIQHGENCSCHIRLKDGPKRMRTGPKREESERMAETLRAFFKRQSESVLPKLGAKAARWWDQKRWDAELADDLEPVIDDVADFHGKQVAAAIGAEYNTAATRKYLRLVAEGKAAAINENTRKELERALEAGEEDEEDTPAHVFEVRSGDHSDTLGKAIALSVAGWASTHEAPEQAAYQGIERRVEKVWITGDNPRPSHALMNGETVPIDEPFSNGAFWPGDDNLSEDESCGCNCQTEILITEG